LDAALGLAQLVALVFLIAWVYPPVRQKLLTLGVYGLGAGILAGVLVVGVFLVRRSGRTCS
jgi:hypothetical protein